MLDVPDPLAALIMGRMTKLSPRRKPAEHALLLLTRDARDPLFLGNIGVHGPAGRGIDLGARRLPAGAVLDRAPRLGHRARPGGGEVLAREGGSLLVAWRSACPAALRAAIERLLLPHQRAPHPVRLAAELQQPAVAIDPR